MLVHRRSWFWSLVETVQAHDLIGGFVRHPANVDVPCVSGPTRCVHDNTDAGGCVFAFAKCRDAAHLLEQFNVLVVTIQRKISGWRFVYSYVGLDTPPRNPEQLLVLKKHVSRTFVSSSMGVEVFDQFSFAGRPADGKYPYEQDAQHCNRGQK